MGADTEVSDFTDSNKQATPERIAELKELGERHNAYLYVAEGIQHALDARTGGPICGDPVYSNIRYDPREVECKECRKVIRKAWRK